MVLHKVKKITKGKKPSSRKTKNANKKHSNKSKTITGGGTGNKRRSLFSWPWRRKHGSYVVNKVSIPSPRSVHHVPAYIELKFKKENIVSCNTKDMMNLIIYYNKSESKKTQNDTFAKFAQKYTELEPQLPITFEYTYTKSNIFGIPHNIYIFINNTEQTANYTINNNTQEQSEPIKTFLKEAVYRYVSICYKYNTAYEKDQKERYEKNYFPISFIDYFYNTAYTKDQEERNEEDNVPISFKEYLKKIESEYSLGNLENMSIFEPAEFANFNNSSST
uniref:Uncharacterized protein n=1 Tax=viral metagenome TaxID=1070528 RepID=A0A6C0HMH7_9ZZZZ